MRTMMMTETSTTFEILSLGRTTGHQLLSLDFHLKWRRKSSMLTFLRFLVLAALLTVALAGCSAPQHGRKDLSDGVPVRASLEPQTAYTPAGAGLPEYWGQPDQPPLLRTEPPFPLNASMPEPMTELFGQPLPLSTDDPEPEKQLGYACAHALDVGSRRVPSMVDRIAAVEGAKARCMVARAYRQCLAAVYEGVKDDKIDLTKYDRGLFQAADGAFRKAHRRMNERCQGIFLTTAEREAVLAISRYGVEQLPNQ